MRYSLLLPVAMLALAGCVSSGDHATQSRSITYSTPDSTGHWLTADQSKGLIVMPGDTTTPAELRYLSSAR